MYWNKANNLRILKKVWINVPNFIVWNEKEKKIGFNEIKKKLNFPLIIRSSFSLEDWKNNSFAGIYDSYFPVYDEKSYKKWLKICLNSDQLDRFKTYTKQKEIDIKNLEKNIIIQEFIIWDFSWICFTKNKKNNIIIEIVPWINDPLAQWNVKNPFSLKIDRNNVKDYEIKSFYMDNEYETIENNILVSKEYDISQFEENIILNFKNKLLYSFLKIEKLFWYPQDIEFSVRWNKIFILQSRNITIL